MARLETGVAVAEQFQIPMWIAATAMFRGWWRAKRGEIRAGIEQFSRGFAHWRDIGCEIAVPWWRAQLAQLHSWHGDSERALALVAESVAQVDRWLEHAHEAEIYRIQGDILLGQESPESQAAEESYQQAIRVAQAQHAKGWELRAAIALARLWQSQGKTREAHDLLVPVYDWFTEGFDTADLKEAKALLEAWRTQGSDTN